MAPKSTDARPDRPARRLPRPLDSVRLEEMALAYVARFATSTGKLAAYLKRKLRERGWEGEHPPDVPGLIARFVARGYIDDAGYARARGQGLLRRGYGARRIDQALGAAGIAEDLRGQASGSQGERRAAALAFARKRRIGPFGLGSADGAQGPCHDPVIREKQMAAMMRAGHPLASARALVNAATVEEAEEWADEQLD